MKNLKRRDFLKMVGVAVMAPTALVKSDSVELDFPKGEWKETIWRITAWKVNPEVYAFYIPSDEWNRGMYKRSEKMEMTPVNKKARLAFRELSPTVVFEIKDKDKGCLIPGDKFNLEIPDKDKFGIYQIFRIEEVIRSG